MKAKEYKDVKMEPCIVRGHRCEFINERLTPESVAAEHKFMYHIRSNDDGSGEPATLEHKVTVNFYGTVVSDIILIPSEKEYIVLDDYSFVESDAEYPTEFNNESIHSTYIYPNYMHSATGQFTELGIIIDETCSMFGWTYLVSHDKDEDGDSRYSLYVLSPGSSLHQSKPSILGPIYFDENGDFISFDKEFASDYIVAFLDVHHTITVNDPDANPDDEANCEPDFSKVISSSTAWKEGPKIDGTDYL